MKLRDYGENTPAADLTDWQRGKKIEAKSAAQGELISDKEIEGFLNSIDLDEINNFLLSEIKRSGSSIEGDQPISRQDFILREKPKNGPQNADFEILERLVYLYPENLRRLAQENGISLKGAVLRAVCHELVHDYSKTDVEGNAVNFFPLRNLGLFRALFARIKSKPVEKLVVKSGYNKTEIIKPAFNLDEPGEDYERPSEQKSYFTNIDEGITEKVALEIMSAYLKRHKDFLSDEEQTQLFAVLTDKNKGAYYSKQVALVEELIDYLSKASGFDRGVVWRAIKRGKFGKENVHDPETMTILKKTLPGDLFVKFFGSLGGKN